GRLGSGGLAGEAGLAGAGRSDSGGNSPGRPGLSRRPQGRGGGAPAIPLQPLVRAAGLSRDAGRRSVGAINRHCEEPKATRQSRLDCFAALAMTKAAAMLSVSLAQDKAQSLVEQARAAGADAADAVYVGERSSGVQVRKGALEDVHRSEGEEIGLR